MTEDLHGKTEIRFPSSESFDWKASNSNQGGIGKLVIDSSSDNFCSFCEYLILVEATKDDTVDLLAVKKAPWELTTIYSGHKYFGELKKGKSEVYLFHNWVSPKTYNANLRVLKGKVSILYSPEKDFKEETTKKLVHSSGDEFFSVECGGSEFQASKSRDELSTRFFKIVAEEDCSYEFGL